jgi:hypothetical protein
VVKKTMLSPSMAGAETGIKRVFTRKTVKNAISPAG